MVSPKTKGSAKGSIRGSTRGSKKSVKKNSKKRSVNNSLLETLIKPINPKLKLKTELEKVQLSNGKNEFVVTLENGYITAKNIGFRNFFDLINLIEIKHKTKDLKKFIQTLEENYPLKGGANNEQINPYIGTLEDVEEVNRLIKLGFVEGLYILNNVGIIPNNSLEPFFNFFPELFEEELRVNAQGQENEILHFMGAKRLVYNNDPETQPEEGKTLYIQEFDPHAPRPNQRFMITRVFYDDDLKFFLDIQGKINPKYINVQGDELVIILQELRRRFPNRVDLWFDEQLRNLGLL